MNFIWIVRDESKGILHLLQDAQPNLIAEDIKLTMRSLVSANDRNADFLPDMLVITVAESRCTAYCRLPNNCTYFIYAHRMEVQEVKR